MNPEPNFLNISASPFDLNAQSSNIIPTKQASNQLPSIQFDLSNGWLDLVGDAENNVVKQTITDRGYYQFEIDGNIFSGDRTSSSFWQGLDGATSENVVGINFDGGLGNDTLIIGSQNHNKDFTIRADDAIQIQGEIHAESLSIKAPDIFNQGIITANSLTAEFSNSYTDTADAQIIAGNILLNGATGNLQAKGQFLATGTIGGKIDFRAATISLNSANLDASGENGGGTILIGGDYQGGSSGNLTNAQSTFIDKYSLIKANANQTGNGGKIIIWADGDTDFQGDILARGGEVAGDGGFAEVSGKQNLNFVGDVDVDALNGNKGNILLDPTNIIIDEDDNDKDTINISDLYKLKGNINLSAANSIVFKTQVHFPDSSGTITLRSGGMVSIFGYFVTGGRNLNIIAGFIDQTESSVGEIITSYSPIPISSGNVLLISQVGINLGSIQTYGGNIILEAGTSITLPYIISSSFIQPNSGDIKVSAKGNISLGSVDSYAVNVASAGNIRVESTTGNIEIMGYFSSGGYNADSGSVTLDGYGDITTSIILTESAGDEVDGHHNAGTVKITSETGKIDTKGIHTSAHNGKAGDVILNAYSDIITNFIHADAFKDGNGGSVTIESKKGEICTNIGMQEDTPFDHNTIVYDAFGNIETRNITTTSLNGIGGNVKLEADGDIKTGSLSSNVFAGSGNGGNIFLTTSNGNITSDYLRSDSVGGNGGSVELISQTGKIDTNFYMDGDVLRKTGNITTTSLTGNAGSINIEASGDIDLGIFASNVFAGAGNGGNISN